MVCDASFLDNSCESVVEIFWFLLVTQDCPSVHTQVPVKEKNISHRPCQPSLMC